MDGCERTQSIQSEKGRDVNNTIKKRWTVEVAFGNFHGPVTFMIVFVQIRSGCIPFHQLSASRMNSRAPTLK